jgi:hypothetical protein
MQLLRKPETCFSDGWVPFASTFERYASSQISSRKHIKKTNTNSGALVRQRAIPTERPPLVGEVNANFSG